jgi:hypothetical protein
MGRWPGSRYWEKGGHDTYSPPRSAISRTWAGGPDPDIGTWDPTTQLASVSTTLRMPGNHREISSRGAIRTAAPLLPILKRRAGRVRIGAHAGS